MAKKTTSRHCGHGFAYATVGPGWCRSGGVGVDPLGGRQGRRGASLGQPRTCPAPQGRPLDRAPAERHGWSLPTSFTIGDQDHDAAPGALVMVPSRRPLRVRKRMVCGGCALWFDAWPIQCCERYGRLPCDA